MFDKLKESHPHYGSLIASKPKENDSSPCRNKIIFVLLLILGVVICISFATHPIKHQSLETAKESINMMNTLFPNKDISNEGFVVDPLCSDLSIYSGNIYCLYPNSDSWDTFDYLRFYQYSILDSLWTEMVNNPLNLGDYTINIPQNMVIFDDNEVYAFSVNPTDLMVNIYSYTSSWRLHHYAPVINGDINGVEMDSIYVNNVLYFSVNEYGASFTYTLYHYTEDIFSVVNIWQKAEVPIYSHCLTQFNGELLTFYVDYEHGLWAYFDDVVYNLDFNIANDILTNQFECIFTENGNILSWKHDSDIYYLQLSPDDFKQIVFYSANQPQ